MPTETEAALAAQREELARLRQITIWQALTTAAAHDPQRHALVAADDAGTVRRLTYAELLDRVRHASAGLAGIGVARGDRVVLWMTNCVEWVVTAFAAMRIGASVVPVNTFLKPPEIRYFIEQSGARHLVMLDRFRALDMIAQLAEICPESASGFTPGHLFGSAVPDLRNVILFARSGGKLAGSHDLAAVLETASPELLALADRMAEATLPSDLAMVKYTSGSTSFPKGVMLEQGGIVANATLHSRAMPVGREDKYFSSMPFFHAGGSIYGLMSMMVNGGTLIFTESFNAPLAADLVISEQATVMITILGNEIVQAAHDRGQQFTSMRLCALPDETARQVMPNVDRCFAAFGLTETYGPAALTTHSPLRPPISPRLLPGNECRIVDPETGLDQPVGVPGELLLRGNVARGYWNKPEESARAFAADGWFHTEDLCSQDAEGGLTWQGRLKLMLKVGGENVSIEEVERVVKSHDAVAECGAVGVPDPRKREAVRIHVQLHEGRTLSEQDLRDWLKPRLAHFKQPRDILFVSSFTRLGNGKLDRVHLARIAKLEEAEPA